VATSGGSGDGGMADLQALHTQAKRLILTIRAGLERLETAEQVGKTLLAASWRCRVQQAATAEAASVANNCWCWCWCWCWCSACTVLSDWVQNTRATVPNGLANELLQQLQQLQVRGARRRTLVTLVPACFAHCCRCLPAPPCPAPARHTLALLLLLCSV
jgi:hypothetical protein